MANPTNPTNPGQPTGQPPGQPPQTQPRPPGSYAPPGQPRPEQLPATAAQAVGITGKPTAQKDKKPGEQTDQPGGGASPMRTYHRVNPDTGLIDVAQLTAEMLADAQKLGEEWERATTAVREGDRPDQPLPGRR